jgi:Adenylate and Guanylate cyclase catalytic domain/AAA ATPase domain
MGGLLRAYQDAVAGEVLRWEGHVAKLMGDGVLAYFGWPQAHEDEAERAVRAGLAIVPAVARVGLKDGGALAARVGIATGLVVVGDLVGEGAAREEAVVGETPNLAARLQALAEPGSVVIAEATRRLLAGLFDLESLGSPELKGLAAPTACWRVLGERPAEGRFEAHREGPLTPLVGRDEELGLLLHRWRVASEGAGQVVLLSGEPGIGKSRVVTALREHWGRPSSATSARRTTPTLPSGRWSRTSGAPSGPWRANRQGNPSRGSRRSSPPPAGPTRPSRSSWSCSGCRPGIAARRRTCRPRSARRACSRLSWRSSRPSWPSAPC